MATLQEYLNQKYPTKEEKEKVKEFNFVLDEKIDFFEELDLSEYVNVEKVSVGDLKLIELILGDKPNLTYLYCTHNQLLSVDFLNSLPNPEKLEQLWIYNNDIRPTNIDIFSRFVNIEDLKIGTMKSTLSLGKHNQFYGSLKSYQNLTKLKGICIEATDVNEGLEYLPFSLAKATRGGKYIKIECSSHDTNAKCSAIQNELRPFNYDLEAWQLSHPEKMLIARPEYFVNEGSKDKWLEALKNKIKQSQEALNYLIQNELNKETKIIRLETQIKILEEVKSQLREEVEEEREIHEDAMKAMDNFYQKNPPREDIRLKNVLQQFEEKYLKLNRENKQKEQKIKELEGTIETVEVIVEQEFQPKETKEQETQTELTGEELEKQQKEIKELREQINKLTVKK